MSQPMQSTGRTQRMLVKERRVLLMLSQGLQAQEIAQSLQISHSYIYHLIRLLKARFDVDTVIGIVKRATELGVLEELEPTVAEFQLESEGEGE